MGYYERRRNFWIVVLAAVGVAYVGGYVDEVMALIVVAIVVLIALVMSGTRGP